MKAIYIRRPLAALPARRVSTWILIATFLGLAGGFQAHGQRLTEFLAVNTNGIKDQFGTPQPWVEIWNQNQVSVLALTNYKLTDGTTTWAIPGIQLMPDERIIIWVSGKNLNTVTAPLHTSFVASPAAGGTISLLNAASAVVSSLANYPAQTPDISWGRDDADTAVTPTLTGFYDTPTPMEKNSTYGGAGLARGVIFSQTSRAFNLTDADAEIPLTLTQQVPEAGAEIRYTTNFTNLASARQQHTATLLPNGRVLLAGGLSGSVLASAELFEPASTSWSATPAPAARRLHTATLLANGKVLVAGGLNTTSLTSSQLYDSATNTWTAGGNLAEARQLHTATLLADGRVLVTGGLGTVAGVALATAELYDPVTNLWTPAAPMTNARQMHGATRLADGRVLVSGGLGASVLDSAELYDPAGNTWSAAGTLTGARQQHTATLLGNGQVLVAGGFNVAALATAELYNPALNSWTATGLLPTARRQHTATLLPGDKVLVAGGMGTGSLNTAMMYDAAAGTWAAVTSMTGSRQQHTATLLNDGRILVAGGSTGSTSVATSEIFNPASNTWRNSPRLAELPDATSPLYTGPIPIVTTQMVRARVFKAGLLPGATATHGFLKLETNARTFNTTMPVTVISSFGVTPPNDGDLASFVWVWEPGADTFSRFSNPPVIASRGVIDKRGSSTLENPKYSLNLETRNPYDEDEQDVELLGMPAHSDWVLHAPYSFDRALLRNPFMYALSNSIGRYAVRNKMSEVFVDATGAGLNFPGNTTGDYFGVYNVMEKIRRNADRVAISKLETYDNDAVRKTGGYIFKVDRRDAGDSGFGAAGFASGTSEGLTYYYPKERDLKSPQRDPQEQYLTGYLNQFYTKLNAANFGDPLLGYATHLDVDATVDNHLMNVWSFNVDALRLSAYWSKDREGKMYPGPIWDFDRTLASTDDRDNNPATWRSTNGDMGTDFFNFTWYNRLFNDADFYQKYIDRWQELRAGPFAKTQVDAILDALNAEISAPAIARDVARWSQSKMAHTPVFPPGPQLTGQAAEVQRIKDFLQQRANFMDTQWVGRVTASVPGGFVSPGTNVTLTGPAGVPIYYTLDGSDPRPSQGGAPTAVSTLYTPGSNIPIATNTRLRARAYNATHTARTGANNPPKKSLWGGPADATYLTDSPPLPGDLLLSEIHYHPADPTPAELAVNAAWTDDDFEFLEIRNISGHAVNLTGSNFNRGVTFGFTGAAARTLAPGESVVIASNPTAYAVRYPAAPVPSGPWDGSLSNSGENLTLVDASGGILFTVDYLDDWIPDSDGPGFSMVAYEFFAANQSSGMAWRASATSGGSPGAWDAASLPISAGPDVPAVIGTAAELRGEAAGSTTPGPPVFAWSVISGPGSLSFSAPAATVTSVTADLPGVYQVRLTMTVNAIATWDDASLFVSDTPASWLARNPGIGSLTDDFDHDGRSNFLEFALMTGASVPDGSLPPELSISNNSLALTYQRHKPRSGVSYVVEISEDLGTFRLPNSGEVTETIVEDNGLIEKVRVLDTALLGTPARRFLRVKVTSP